MKESTKNCPKCNSDRLILYYGENMKQCSICMTDIPWYLSDGQKPLFEGCATKTKEEKDNG